MRILELFAGTESLAKAARAKGHEVITLDISEKHNPTVCVNILEWDYTVLPPDHFDYIHASCPCENYSQCRTTGGQRNLEQADALVEKTLQIFAYFKTALWTVENPGGSLLWTRPVARPLLEQRAKTSYCRYGFPYRKNTWFANNFKLELKAQCDRTCGQMIDRKHRQHAQRGGGGAESISHTLDELHRIPPELCKSLLEQIKDSCCNGK